MPGKQMLWNACLFFFSLVSHAQQYPFIQYTPKDGLVNSRVRKIYQDSRGRIYFMTYGGLSVYDGSRFRNYSSQNGLLEDMVNDVVEMGKDSFLVATNAGGVNLLENGKMRPFGKQNIEPTYINDFIRSADGSIYATSDQGLYQLKDQEFEKLPIQIAGRTGITFFLGNIVEFNHYFVFTSNDLIGFKGIFLYDKKRKVVCDSISSLVIASLKKDPRGNVWLSLRHKICQLDTNELNNGKIKIIPAPTAVAAGVNFGSAYFAFDRKATWVVRDGEELVRIGDDGSLLKIPGTNKLTLPGFGNIFIDHENILWFTNEGAGVSKLVNTNLQIRENLPGENMPGVISNISYTPDTTWFILRDNGLLRKTGNQYKKFRINVSDQIVFIAQKFGKVIIGTNKKLYASQAPADSKEKIDFTNIHTLNAGNNMGSRTMYDEYGNLFFNTQNALMVLHRNGRVSPVYQIEFNDLVDEIQKDSRKLIWLVTRYRGLIAIRESPDYIDSLPVTSFHFTEPFQNMSPRSMAIDKNDIIWVGTRTNGLLGFELKNDSLNRRFQYRIQQGITDNFITSLGCDSSNNVIVGTQSGIDRLVYLPNKNYRVENVTKSNNIFGYITRMWIDSKGNVNALRNAGTILSIAKDTLPQPGYEPDLFVEEMKVNGVTVSHATEDLVLPYYQRNISFSVAAPSFLDEKQIQYSYRLLSEANNEWNEPSGNAGINLVNLSPGKYDLHIRADFPSTPYRTKEMRFSFRILPPWWETWWFRVMALATVIGGIVLLVRGYFKRKLEREKVLLEKQQAIEKERTRIATDMHDDLGAGLSRIKYLSETIRLKQDRGKIDDEVEKISAYSDEMVEKMGEIVWALNQKNDTLADLVSFTRSYATDYLTQHDLHCNTSIEGHIPEVALNGETRRNIFLSVKESLHNIVKHAGATGADLIFSVRENFRIIIHDNGKGFDMNLLTKRGNGLYNISKRMAEVQGRAEFKNEKGTTVILTIPLLSV